MMAVSLENHLHTVKIDHNLRHLICTIARTAKYVHHAMQTGDLGLAGTSNMYGEAQLALDVLSNQIFVKELQESTYTTVLASEEMDEIIETPEDKKGDYAVVFDPLDGSSLVNANLAIGSIFGIYKGEKLIGRTGNEMAAALYVIYGPRVTLVYSIGNGVHEFILNAVGEFVLSKENIKVEDEAKNFAPGNLRAAKENEKYAKLFKHWVQSDLTLRYSGGMVPDINHIFMKGQGIFTYPKYKDAPKGKLRLLFECAPMAYLMEKAGGRATDGQKRILDVKIETLDQRTPIFIGSGKTVKKAESIMK
ncbi:fructose-1,6-bisphosphatase [Candidatus Peregrinibacteria bacterium]|nr:fructose-1,6-bisphosphatase [Candidatus Peregrinibacteria bacterium]